VKWKDWNEMIGRKGVQASVGKREAGSTAKTANGID
jgi:hypothetical protein